MPRLRQVPKSDDNPPVVQLSYSLLFGDRDPVSEPGTNTGTPGDWWTVFALAPDVLQHCVDGFLLYNSRQRRIDPVLRELGQARVGWTVGSQFVWSQHCKSLRGLGVADEWIAAIPHWQAADCFDRTQRLLLAYTDALVYDRGRAADGLFAALREALSDEEILEFTYITSLYMMHGVMSKALRTEFDDRDEPIVEVEGPDGVAPWDGIPSSV